MIHLNVHYCDEIIRHAENDKYSPLPSRPPRPSRLSPVVHVQSRPTLLKQD